MIDLKPIAFKPYLKSVIWGGDKICGYKGIPEKQSGIGESWEISAVPGHESVVADGPYEGSGSPTSPDSSAPNCSASA